MYIWKVEVRHFQNKIRILLLRWLPLTFSDCKTQMGEQKCVTGLCSVKEKGLCQSSTWAALPHLDVVTVYVDIRGYRFLPLAWRDKIPVWIITFMTSALASSIIEAFLPHPLPLSTGSGTLQSLTQLHWSPFSPHAPHPVTPESFLGSLDPYAHGLWLCTAEWFIRYWTLQQGLSSSPPTPPLTRWALLFSKCIKFWKCSGGETRLQSAHSRRCIKFYVIDHIPFVSCWFTILWLLILRWED